MRTCVLILLLLSGINSFSQNLSNHNWYFGSSQNGITFNISDNQPNDVTDQNPALGMGGSAVATDHQSGDLLFYTDGVQVFDRSHGLMSNGGGLNGNNSFNQAAAISPRPGAGNDAQYLIFSNNGNIWYHIVDMDDQGNAVSPAPPLGRVIDKNRTDADIPSVTGAMLLFETGRGPYQYWLLVQEAGTNTFHLFFILANDIVPVKSITLPLNVTSAHFAYHPPTGRIAIAPQNSNTNIQILQFDLATDTLSYDSELLNTAFNDGGGGESAYDVEWSPDGSKIFISRFGDAGQIGALYRYDLSNPMAALDQVSPQALYRSFGIQNGPDGALYHLYQENSAGPIQMGRITNPDSILAVINYEALPLGAQNYDAFQFPSFSPRREVTFNSSSFSYVGDCFGTPTKFYATTDPPADEYFWDFGDLFNPNPDPITQRFQAPVYEYTQPGDYTVRLITRTNGDVDTLTQIITIIQTDTVDLGQDTVICPGEVITLDAGPGGLTYFWNTFETGQSIEVDSMGYYWVVVNYGLCTSYDAKNVEVYGEQQQVANVWYFGDNAGIDFNPQPPVPLTDGQTQAPAGVAGISDRNGQNLFYTDGNTVYNRLHGIVDNNIGGDRQSTQSSIVVPFPDDETLFYIFTTKDIWNTSNDHSYVLSYSVMDIKEIDTTTAKYGELVAKDIPLFSKSTERIAAIQMGQGYWLLTHEFGNNTFRAYPITDSGIGPPVLTSIGSPHSGASEAGEGYMKFSGGGNRVAVALSTPMGNYVELFDFDPATGELSNYIQIELAEGSNQYNVYGLEFASGGDKLFVTLNNQGMAQSRLYELKLHNYNKDSIEANIDLMSDVPGVNFGALQTGPDGQIYMAIEDQVFVGNFMPDLDTIRTTSYDFDLNRFDLMGGISKLGLPNFVQNFTNQPPVPTAGITAGCIGQTSFFTGSGTSSIDEFLWSFGDGGSDMNPVTEHIYLAPDTYNVTFNVSNRCGYDTTLVQDLTIVGNPNEPTFIKPGVICDTELLIDADTTNTAGLTFQWNTGETSKVISVTQPANYSVTITNQEGCISSDTIEVFDGRPQMDLGPNMIVCQDDSVGLNTGLPAGFPPHTFQWTVNGAPLANNNFFLIVDTSTPGVFDYRVRVIDGLTSCIAEDSVTITINPSPTATYNVINSSCGNNNGSIEITSPLTNLGVEWQDNVGGVLGTAALLDMISAGIYNLFLTDNITGCQNNYAIGVVDSTVNFTIATAVRNNCDGDSIDVTLTNVLDFTGAGYTLIDNINSTSTSGLISSLNFSIGPVIASNYTLQVTAEGCTDQQTNIQVNVLPTVDLLVDPIYVVCSDNPGISATSATGGASIQWLSPSGTILNGASIVAPESGIYELTASAGGACDTTALTDVTINNAPEANIIILDDGCTGSRQIAAEVLGSGNYSYLWSTGATGPGVTVTSTGNYDVEVRDQSTGCDTTTAAFVEVFAPLSVTIAVDQVACDDNNEITLTAVPVPAQTATYNWFLNGTSLGITTPELATTDQGLFRVDIATDHCDAFSELGIVRVPSTPSDIKPLYQICPEPPLNESAVIAPGDFVNYLVFNLETGQEVIETSPGVFEITEDGTYSFNMENIYGCETLDTTAVVKECKPAIYAPNAFSPYATIPENQTFKIYPSFIGEFEIFIYNRWGELIFHSDDLEFMVNEGWNGTKNGELLPLGTYAYVMKFTSLTSPELGVIEQPGGITLLR